MRFLFTHMSWEERRIDPADGVAYTFQEIFAYYRNMYAPFMIKQYWEAMKPAVSETNEPEEFEPEEFRFKQGDRVLCNLGDRRLAGTVLSRDVEDPEDPEGERIAYVVKTDAIPGVIEGNTISAPADEDLVICRERCFNAKSESSYTKWAAPIIQEQHRKVLRFGPGEEVAIRVQDRPDGYEQWVCGRVSEVWPALPGRVGRGFLTTASHCAYKVNVGRGNDFYCHRDDHTLIRLPANIPKKPGKTISKRFENRKLPDGSVERFDHVTLRSKRVTVEEEEDEDSDEDD